MIKKQYLKDISLIAAMSVLVTHSVQSIANEGDHGHEADKEHHEADIEHHGEEKHEEHKHDEERKADLGAHEHGHGQLNVVVENADVIIEFHVPAMNLVGFEHRAETPEQKQAVSSAVEKLQQPDTLFKVDKGAECAFSAVSAEHHEPDEGGDHAEFEASYTLQCAKPEKLTQLDVSLFDVLDNMEEIEVQVVTPDLQTLVEITEAERSVPLSQ